MASASSRVAEFDQTLLRGFERFALYAALFVLLVGGSVLIGWWLQTPILKSVVPGLVSMNPVTALTFIFASASLLIVSRADGGRAQSTGRILGLVVVVIGALQLSDDLFETNLSLDGLLFQTQLAYDGTLGIMNRMAPNTALCFVLIGTALAVLDYPVVRSFRVAEGLVLAAAVVAVLAVIGYVYGAHELYRVASFMPMAFNTAVAFTVLCVGILCARPTSEITAVLSSNGAGSVMARRILPVVTALVLVIGWLAMLGDRLDLYGIEFGTAFFATANIILLSVAVWWVAASLNRTERARRSAEEHRLVLASSAIERVTEGVVIADGDNRIVSVNPAFTAMTGHTETELLGRTLRAYEARPEDLSYDVTQRDALRVAGQWQGETWLRAKTGEMLPNMMTVSAVRNHDGQNTHFITIFKDLSQYKHDQAKLEFLAHYDPLTHLANRKRLLDWTRSAIARAQSANGVVSLLLIDIDNFHLINDSLGNPAGDLVLQAVAQRLSQRLGEHQLLACLGGDQFVVLLDNATPTTLVAQRFIDMFVEPFSIIGRELHLSSSVGIACYPQDGADAETLLKNAEAAVRESHRQGSNSYRYFSAVSSEPALDRLLLRHDLHRAIEHGEFFLEYQLRTSVRSGEITGVEALIRWQHPQRGLIGPTQFIPIAEEGGLIDPIGDWVVHTAIKQLKAWLDAGVAPMRMAINLSARQFRQESLADRIAASIEEHGVAANLIELEITESMAMHDPMQTTMLLSNLKRLGVRISIDDFGTGHSSLAYLKRFPIDHLKIDQSFVRGVPNDNSDVGIVRSIIALAHSLKIGVIAEGVETESQKRFLQAERCDEIQGFLFSEPKLADELQNLLIASKTKISL